MILQNLRAYNYRNLNDLNLEWNSRFNILYGSNGQGKTNLLEAIYLFAHLKSFRNARGRDLIRHGIEVARLNVDIKGKLVQHKLDITLNHRGRNPRVEGKTVQKLSHFIGYLRTVLFTPEELALVKGYPAGRRALLDRAILQIDPTYLDRVQEFDRILQQRNRLLKQQSSSAELAPWTVKLISAGASIRFDRIKYIQRFRPQLKRVYQEITGGSESAELYYSVEAATQQELSRQLAEDLERRSQREYKLGQTLAGPHRDDLDFIVNGHLLKNFGSQGQQRSFLLAFKAAQIIDMEEQLHEAPILLLDDLASELDSSRLDGFFAFLQQRKSQVFFTSAQLPSLSVLAGQAANYYRVDQGTVVLTTPE